MAGLRRGEAWNVSRLKGAPHKRSFFCRALLFPLLPEGRGTDNSQNWAVFQALRFLDFLCQPVGYVDDDHLQMKKQQLRAVKECLETPRDDGRGGIQARPLSLRKLHFLLPQCRLQVLFLPLLWGLPCVWVVGSASLLL